MLFSFVLKSQTTKEELGCLQLRFSDKRNGLFCLATNYNGNYICIDINTARYGDVTKPQFPMDL